MYKKHYYWYTTPGQYKIYETYPRPVRFESPLHSTTLRLIHSASLIHSLYPKPLKKPPEDFFLSTTSANCSTNSFSLPLTLVGIFTLTVMNASPRKSVPGNQL